MKGKHSHKQNGLRKTWKELHNEKCSVTKKDHAIWLSLLGDGKPAFCIDCGDWCSDVPPSKYENF